MTSPRTRVLVLSSVCEPSVDDVLRELDALGVSWFRLNTEILPLGAQGGWHVGGPGVGPRFEIKTPAGALDLATVTHVWARRVPPPLVPRGLRGAERTFFENEVRAFLHTMFGTLAHARWINPSLSERAAANKPNQLVAAREAGLEVPETLVTNDPTDAIEFAERMWGRGEEVAFKPIGGFLARPELFSKEAAEAYADCLATPADLPPEKQNLGVVFTQRLDREKMAALGHIRVCPVVFQQYIQKSCEYRVTVVGNRVFSCRISSQEREETSTDFRRLVLLERAQMPTHAEASLPAEVEASILKLMKRLDLVFGCVDLICTPDNRFVFLEVNPSGQWQWVERLTGMPISRTLAEVLSN